MLFITYLSFFMFIEHAHNHLHVCTRDECNNVEKALEVESLRSMAYHNQRSQNNYDTGVFL